MDQYDDCYCGHPLYAHLHSGRCSWPHCKCQKPDRNIERVFFLATTFPLGTLANRGLAMALGAQHFIRWLYALSL